MQTAFILIPTILFFGIYKFYDIYAATAALMISVTVLTLIEWVRTRKANKLHLVSSALLLVFGGITLVLREPEYLMWKFTIYHWVIALVLLWTQFKREKTGIQSFFETLGDISAGKDDEALDFSSIPERKFRICNITSVIYFFLVGAVNLLIAYGMSEEAWVNFKVFGMMGANFVFLLSVMFWLFYSEFSQKEDSQ